MNPVSVDHRSQDGGRIRLHVNGEARELPAPITVAGLLEELALRPELVAVEVNGTLVPRARRAAHRLAGGDAVELVTLVGGG